MFMHEIWKVTRSRTLSIERPRNNSLGMCIDDFYVRNVSRATFLLQMNASNS